MERPQAGLSIPTFMWQVLHGKRGRVIFISEPLSGSEFGMITLGEWLLGMDEADANGLEEYTEFVTAYNWRLLISADRADTSRLNTEWRELIPGLGTFNGRLEGFADTTDEGQEVLHEVLSGQRRYVEAHLYGATDVGFMRAGLMVNSFDHETMVNGAQRVGFEFLNWGRPAWENVIDTDKISRNMLGYWAFDEGAGIAAEDSAPYGVDGVLVGSPIWTTGKKNSALQFNNGAHVAVVKKHPLEYRYFLSISLWFKQLGTPNGGAHGLIGDTSGTNGWRLVVGADGKVTFTIGDVSVTSVEEINPTEWNHIVATYHPVKGRIRIYINNIEDMVSGSRTGPVPDNTNDITIATVGAMQTNGIVDQVRIYGVELTKDPIDVGGIIGMLYSQGE